MRTETNHSTTIDKAVTTVTTWNEKRKHAPLSFIPYICICSVSYFSLVLSSLYRSKLQYFLTHHKFENKQSQCFLVNVCHWNKLVNVIVCTLVELMVWPEEDSRIVWLHSCRCLGRSNVILRWPNFGNQKVLFFNRLCRYTEKPSRLSKRGTTWITKRLTVCFAIASLRLPDRDDYYTTPTTLSLISTSRASFVSSACFFFSSNSTNTATVFSIDFVLYNNPWLFDWMTG